MGLSRTSTRLLAGKEQPVQPKESKQSQSVGPAARTVTKSSHNKAIYSKTLPTKANASSKSRPSVLNTSDAQSPGDTSVLAPLSGENHQSRRVSAHTSSKKNASSTNLRRPASTTSIPKIARARPTGSSSSSSGAKAFPTSNRTGAVHDENQKSQQQQQSQSRTSASAEPLKSTLGSGAVTPGRTRLTSAGFGGRPVALTPSPAPSRLSAASTSRSGSARAPVSPALSSSRQAKRSTSVEDLLETSYSLGTEGSPSLADIARELENLNVDTPIKGRSSQRHSQKAPPSTVKPLKRSSAAAASLQKSPAAATARDSLLQCLQAQLRAAQEAQEAREAQMSNELAEMQANLLAAEATRRKEIAQRSVAALEEVGRDVSLQRTQRQLDRQTLAVLSENLSLWQAHLEATLV